jgi:hypothetical protein
MHALFALADTLATWFAVAWSHTAGLPLLFAWHLLGADFTAVMGGLAASVLLIVAVLATGWFRKRSTADADAIEAGRRDEPGA